VGERSGLYVGPDGDEDLYELVLILGGGGQGQVWKAQMRPDRDSEAVVSYAVKVIEPAEDDEPEVDWIRRAKSLWNLDHPGVVRMFEPFVGAPMHYAGCTTGRTGERVRYLVMDLVDGLPLNEWVEDNPAATLSQRIGTLRMIAAALDMMHMPSKGSDRSPVAHGDIKPSNILVQPSGASKLVDFGLARVVGARGVPGVGSLPYLAPELLTSSDGLPTPDSDRFSFAATLFTVLTGALPPRSADRGPDLDRTRTMLAASPLVSSREGLLEQVMEGLGEPAGRPRGLATWLEGFRTQTMTTPSLFPAGSPYAGSPYAGPAAPAPAPRRGRVLIGAVSAVALLVGGGGALALARSDTGRLGAIARGSPLATPAQTTTAAGSMPNVVGSPVASATTQLTASRLPPPTVLEEIDPRATDGQILSQSPAAGTRHPKAIVLVVARAAVVSYLQDLSAVNDDPDLGMRSVAGRAYPHSIYSTLATCDKRSTVEYNLGKHYRELQATAGLDDSSLYSAGKILFEAFLDSRPVFARTVGLGQSVPVRVSAQGALRLKLRLTYVGPRPRHCLDEIAVWGDARLLGVPSEVPTPDPNAA
jgi:Protein kinase domain/NPCBM/NEW2 domain/PASTA domain